MSKLYFNEEHNWYGAECPVDTTESTAPTHTVYLSEIHYNPSTAQGSDTDFEFIELHNPAATTAHLWGWNVAGAITAELPQSAQIMPGGFLVLARNADSLCVLVPSSSPCFEWDSGQSLNNTGETSTITFSAAVGTGLNGPNSVIFESPVPKFCT